MVVVIVNKGAGQGKSGDVAEGIRAAFHDADVQADVQVIDGKDIASAVRLAASSGASVVVAAGGDGTVSSVASGLVATQIPLGVLPMGTLNHFAKDLGIPLDLESAVRAIASGKSRAIDVASVNDHIFVNNSSIGLYPLMVRDRDKQRGKFKRSKWWAMIRASANIFRRFPTVHVRLQSDASNMHCQTPAVFVGNNRYKIEAFTLGTRDNLEDGVLSVFAVRTQSKWRTLGLMFTALFSKLEESELFDISYPEELWLDTPLPSMPVSLDGEVLQLKTPLHYQILKKTLLVILPPSS